MKNSNILEIKKLVVWYKKDNDVLADFDMELGRNEVVGLIGLNGAGKTTFMKTLAGLISNYSVEQMRYCDKEIRLCHNHFKKKRYVVFEKEESFQYFTFREYLSYVAKAYEKEMTDVEELIEGFQFTNYTDSCLKELSTGNQKKAYLITAFALKPELLLLDEPVNGLDFQSTEYLYRLMENYKTYGTLLFSSHILESICLTSDKVVVLEKGKIRKTFGKEEINSENIREVLSKNDVTKSIF